MHKASDLPPPLQGTASCSIKPVANLGSLTSLGGLPPRASCQCTLPAWWPPLGLLAFFLLVHALGRTSLGSIVCCLIPCKLTPQTLPYGRLMAAVGTGAATLAQDSTSPGRFGI